MRDVATCALRGDRHVRLPHQHEPLHVGGHADARPDHDRQIQFPCVELGEQLHRHARHDVQVRHRPQCRPSLHGARQQPELHRQDRADVNGRERRLRVARACLATHGLIARDHALCLCEQSAAVIGQRYRATGAFEQRNAEIVLQTLDLGADRRLRQPQTRSRRRKRRGFGCRDEGFEISDH
ncbi:hypothetical protein A6P55_02160 [Pandoraea pnomenusa]|nr:hypothetical protein A6P55_02160 [Pandoraea pnomenusa]